MPENGNRRRRHRPRSKSHKETSATSAPKSTSQDYLHQLESKLDRAKMARDNYLDHLKQKYPSWNSNYNACPPPYSSHQSHVLLPGQIPNYLGNLPPAFEMPQPQRRSLISDLQTSQYFWNPPETIKTNESYRRVELLNTTEPIPSSSIYLETDMPNVLNRLQQIQTNLKDLKEHRLSMPTVEYFRKVAPDLKADLSNLSTSYYGKKERADIPSLAELKSRILNMDLHVEKRSREILDEAWNRKKRKEEKEFVETKLFEDNHHSKMPEWLKERKSAVEEMEDAKREEEKVVVQTIQPQLSQIIHQQNVEVKENPGPQEVPKDVIAPTRRIVFGQTTATTTTSLPAEVKTKSPPLEKTTKPAIAPTKHISPPSSSPSPPPAKAQSEDSKSSYNKMLELLRPKTYQVTTSSSSSEDEFAAITSKSKPPSTTTSSTIPATIKPIKTPPQLIPQPPSFLSKPNPVAAAIPSLSKTLNLTQISGKDDSDDDFFN